MDSICEIAHRLLMSSKLRKYEGCDDVLDLITLARLGELKVDNLQRQMIGLIQERNALKDENKFLLSQINEDVNHAAKDV